jgi:uncharacterized protein with PhoU and TrkA domain
VSLILLQTKSNHKTNMKNLVKLLLVSIFISTTFAEPMCADNCDLTGETQERIEELKSEVKKKQVQALLDVAGNNNLNSTKMVRLGAANNNIMTNDADIRLNNYQNIQKTAYEIITYITKTFENLVEYVHNIPK